MLKRNLIANYFGQGWTALMGLPFVPLYIKYLGIEAYGLIGIFALLQVWLSLLDMGMTPTLGREMARFSSGGFPVESIRDLLRTLETIALMIAVVIAGSIAIGSEWIAADWLKTEEIPVEVVAQAFTIMGMVWGLRFVEGIYRSSIIGLQRQVLFNVVDGVMATLRGLGAVAILALFSPTIQAFFLWQGLISIATVTVLATTTYGSLPHGFRGGHFSMAALLGVWRFAAGVMAISLSVLIVTQVDKVLLSRLLGLADYGYYILATVVTAVLYKLSNPITQAFYPRLCELYARKDHAAFVSTVHKGAQLVSVIVGSAAIVLTFFSEPLLHLWTQDKALAQSVAPLVSILAFGNMLSAQLHIPTQAQYAFGRTALILRVNMIAAAAAIPLLLWIAPSYGALGAAWVWVFVNLGYLIFGIHYMFAGVMAPEKRLWYIHDLFIPLAVGILSAYAVRVALPLTEDPIEQTVALTVVTLVTFVSMAASAPHARTHFSGILRRYGSRLN
jgi:O-antigen/teichoic acid export membrane protein